jgi:hypothetical protein
MVRYSGGDIGLGNHALAPAGNVFQNDSGVACGFDGGRI